MLIFADLGQGRSRRYNASRAFIALGGRGDEPARVCGRLARAQSLDLISFNARSAARNVRKSLTGAPGAEGRVLQWSCHKWSSEGRVSAPEDGTKASERSFSGANWL